MRKIIYLFCLIIVFLYDYISLSNGENALIISTINGKVKGFRKQIVNKYVDVFYGIPYAKPPIGNLKFKRPQPVDPWKVTRDASKKWFSCIQSPISEIRKNYTVPYELEELLIPNSALDEDCLTVNVWTPSIRDPNLKLLDVLVWVHGGGYMMGSSYNRLYDGAYLSAHKDVVFVSMNYRLGAAGFLYLGTEDIPGNMGYYDQSLAFDWVKENVKVFGGNPQSVTIIGESAGGYSVSSHFLSPVSREKFNRVVIQSGTTNSESALISPEDSLKKTYDLAKTVGCGNKIEDKIELAECLRQIPVENLDKAIYDTLDINRLEISFSPVNDGHFFPKSSREMLLEGNFKKPGEAMIGTTANEFDLILSKTYPDLFNNDGLIRELTSADMDAIIKKLFQSFPELAQTLFKFLYTDWNNPENSTAIRYNIGDLMNDMMFTCPSKSYAASLANYGVNTYFYQYAHVTERRLLNKFYGAHHGEDLLYFFGLPFYLPSDYTEDERLLSDRMMNYLVTFANTGNPVNDNSWNKYSSKNQVHQRLDVNGPQMVQGPRAVYCEFWNSILPKVLQSAVSSGLKCDGKLDSETGVCYKK